MTRHPVALLWLPLLVSSCGVEAPRERPPFDALTYAEEDSAWRVSRLRAIAGPDGWITLAGLYWLEAPTYSLGGAGADISLPGTDSVVGRLDIDGGAIRFTAASKSQVTLRGELLDSIALQTDAGGARPTVLTAGTSTFRVLDRSGRLALRVKDSASTLRREFTGIETFAIDTSYRVLARLERPGTPDTLRLTNIVGLIEDHAVAGTLHFALNGRAWTLDAVHESGDSGLFILFRDATTGTETYPAGRYLQAPAPDSTGLVVLDFNRAYNPPCAFTAFATCPLPPRQNVLPIAIRAGERRYTGAHGDDGKSSYSISSTRS